MDPVMPVVNRSVSREALEGRRIDVLDDIGLTWEQLTDRRAAGVLTPDEWEAWEELDGLNCLLEPRQEDHS